MPNQITFNLDSTSLSAASCLLNYKRTVIGELEEPIIGAYKSIPNSAMIYGVAVHKFTDVMFKTNGHYPTARLESEKSFNVPKILTNEKLPWLNEPKHLGITNYELWSNYIEPESSYEVLMISQECWWCKGVRSPKNIEDGVLIIGCKHCNGSGIFNGPATELTFKILFYEDEFIKVNLCGTIDSVGKFKNGCYAIRDWKTTSSWGKESYLESYELSRQLRIYTLACKLMARTNPDSVLGRVGSTKMGAFIDGIFLKPKANDNEYMRSQVFQYSDKEIAEFEQQLLKFCSRFSRNVSLNYFPKEGILNGTCEGKYGKCRFWSCCKSNDNISNLLLKRDFKRVIYDPLHFNEE